MRKLLLALAVASAFTLTEKAAAVVIFSENMGTASGGNQTIAANQFQNEGTLADLSYTGTADTRTSTGSTGYTGASGGRNVFLTNGSSANFIISDIDTTGYEPAQFTLSFGAYKTTTASNMSTFTLAYSTDGLSFTSIVVPAQPTGSGTANWRLITLSNITLPVSATLSLRWVNSDATTQYRLDDVTLSGVAAVPEPTTSAMLLGGVGVAIWVLRRKRRLKS